MQAKIVSFLAIVHLASAAATTACNANNCLRAVRASAFPTRLGSADCSSYFKATVTPATITFTHTAFITNTPSTTTTTFSATNTFTPTPVTQISFTTVTSTPAVVTVPTISLSTVTLFPSCVPKPGIPRRDVNPIIRGSPHIRQAKQERGVQALSPALVTAAIQARQITISPSSIPTYASACSGAVGYASACSCIGVTRTTVTAVAPSTTITITNTIQAATPSTTLSLTFSTTLVPVTTTISNTITQILVASTTTSTIVTIVTETPAPYCSFKLVNKEPGQPLDGSYVRALGNDIGAGTYPYYAVTGTSSDASIFNCDAAGHLIYNNNYALVPKGSTNAFFDFGPADASSDLVTCPVDANGISHCSVNGADLMQFCLYQSIQTNILVIANSELVGSDGGARCDILNLAVVPIAC